MYKILNKIGKVLFHRLGIVAVLIIAQRVSTIRHADQILVIDEGHPVGLGTHEQLMETCEVYQEIVASQTKQAV